MVLVQKELKNAYIWIPNPTSIVLDKISISLTTIWQTEQLTATIEPEVSDKTITWSSDDTTVATVSTTGLVTCVTPWTCTITATTVNGLTASCSVDDSQWWQPWVNTICYYPLDSTNTVNDLSWHSYTLTNSWGVTFWTNQWVDCAWFTSWGSSSWSRWLYRTSDTIITPQSTDLTFHVWLYKWSETMYYNPRIIGRYGYPIFTYASRSKISTADSTAYGITPVEWAWFLFSCVYKYSDKTWAYYLNGVYQNTQSNSTQASYSNSWIVLGTRDNLSTGYGDKWSWWMSNLIIENKAWTAQEVADYYDQTKSNYLRQPWANTIAYWKFEDDIKDYSWNWYDITSANNTQLTILNWVKCLNLNNSYCAAATIDTLSTYNNYTIIWWYYLNWTVDIKYTWGGAWGWSGIRFRSGGWDDSQIRWGNPTNTYSQWNYNTPTWQWFMFAIVVNSGYGIVYKNTTETVLKSQVVAPINNTTPFRIGADEEWTIRWNWYISRLIIEKQWWTAQEVSDYYNQTKWGYWIS